MDPLLNKRSIFLEGFSYRVRPKTTVFFSLRCKTTDNIFFFFVFLR